MTIPNYLQTFRRAARELAVNEKNEINEKSPDLISLNSFISCPPSSKKGTPPVAGIVPALTYAEAFEQLERRCPDYIQADRWQQAVEDAQTFLAKWGRQAEAFGWSADELFGLHAVPAQPAPSYSRLSRYDCTGLLWLLQGGR